jgi:DNA/RNA-binding domain of Phe-tRNA-synthetase-like protein
MGGSHLAAWADVFQKFGAKPKRTPCSADALRKRVLRDGTMPALDPIVDLYNAVSLRYAVPVGGENISAYQGSPRLAVAKEQSLLIPSKRVKPPLNILHKGGYLV